MKMEFPWQAFTNDTQIHMDTYTHIETRADSGIYTLLTFILKINIGKQKLNRWNHLFDWIQQHCHLFISVCFQFSFQNGIIKILLKITSFPLRFSLTFFKFRSTILCQFFLSHFTKKTNPMCFRRLKITK